MTLKFKGMIWLYHNIKSCLYSIKILISDFGSLPGHGGTLQTSVFVALPAHFPPFASFTIFTLVLTLFALPQVAEQVPLLHAPQTH